MRNKHDLTQFELAKKAGVGIRFIRDIEQGKETLRMDKLNQVLSFFGYRTAPGLSRKKDQWEILVHFMNQHIRLFFKNQNVITGFIISYKIIENEVKYWMFVSTKNIIKYNQFGKDESLVEQIPKDDILKIEYCN